MKRLLGSIFSAVALLAMSYSAMAVIIYDVSDDSLSVGTDLLGEIHYPDGTDTAAGQSAAAPSFWTFTWNGSTSISSTGPAPLTGIAGAAFTATPTLAILFPIDSFFQNTGFPVTNRLVISGSDFLVLEPGSNDTPEVQGSLSIVLRGQTADPLPEPGTLPLLGLGLMGAGYLARRRRNA